MTDLPGMPDETSIGRLFPWLRLVRALGMALDPKKLVLAAVALIVLPIGWEGLDRLFGLDDSRASARAYAAEIPRLGDATGPWNRVEVRPAEASGSFSFALGTTFTPSWSAGPWLMTEPVRVLAGPFLRIFSSGNTIGGFAHAVLSALWGVVVGGLIGGAIARIAVVQAAREERVGLRAAVRFARRHWFPLIGTPLGPMVSIAFFALPVALFGLLYRVPGIGPGAAGVLLFLPLLAGLVMSIIVVGLAAGWPLMASAVAAEDEDAFDALSRSYAYINQRPGHYAAYVILAWLIGIVGWAFVAVLATLVVQLTHWALSIGASGELLDPLFDQTAIAGWPRSAHAFWLSLVRLLAHAWIYAYFWSAAALIYLLLRRAVDGTPWHEVAGSVEPDPAAEALEVPDVGHAKPVPTEPAPEVVP